MGIYGTYILDILMFHVERWHLYVVGLALGVNHQILQI
jgi:hypothetical protein